MDFGMFWIMGALGERKKKKEILRECWLIGGMVLDWYLWYDYVGNDFSPFLPFCDGKGPYL